MEHKGINAKAWFYGQPGFHGQRIAAPLVTVCSWCGPKPVPGEPLVSHGLCEACATKMRDERTARRAK